MSEVTKSIWCSDDMPIAFCSNPSAYHGMSGLERLESRGLALTSEDGPRGHDVALWVQRERPSWDLGRSRRRRNVLLIVEPPVVRPDLYLPRTIARYDAVVSMASTGGNVHYCYPTHRTVHRQAFECRELVCLFNSNKQPRGHMDVSLYRERVAAIEGLLAASHGRYPHVYGQGWDGVPTYKGYVADKIQAMSRYAFCICFENAVWPGYVTEKIADCMYAGVVPIYRGAPDIDDYVPRDCYIDAGDFGDYASLHDFMVRSVQDALFLRRYTEAMDEFLASRAFAGRFSSVAFAEALAEACDPVGPPTGSAKDAGAPSDTAEETA